MLLVHIHMYPMGTFLLGVDRKNTPHGIFCWSAEQVAFIARDWRLSYKDEMRLGKILLREEIALKSKEEPRLIHGIGAALIHTQFDTLREIRDITKPETNIPLPSPRIYHRALAANPKEQEAALLFYMTPEGQATLAHVCTQDQAAELLYLEDWMRDQGRDIVEGTIKTLPKHDRFNQHPVFVHGTLVQQLIMAQVIYRQFFPETSTAN